MNASLAMFAGRLSVLMMAALAAASPAAAQTANGGGQREGVTVHGHWIIDVRNPDGSLASHVEFDNDLLQFGAGIGGHNALAAIMGRSRSVGLWQIRLIGPPPPPGVIAASGGPCASGGFPAQCYIVEPANTFTATYTFSNLVVDVPQVSTPFGPRFGPRLELSGTATAANSTVPIYSVQTFLTGCANTDSSAACSAATAATTGAWFFTGTTLPSPIALTTGQLIQVKVILAFT
jgi:hypothetical protein